MMYYYQLLRNPGNFTGRRLSAERSCRSFSARRRSNVALIASRFKIDRKGNGRESKVVSAVNTIHFSRLDRVARVLQSSIRGKHLLHGDTACIHDCTAGRQNSSDAFVIMIYSEFAFLMNNKRRQLDVVCIPFVESRRDSVTYHSRRHTVRMFLVAEDSHHLRTSRSLLTTIDSLSVEFPRSSLDVLPWLFNLLSNCHSEFLESLNKEEVSEVSRNRIVLSRKVCPKLVVAFGVR